MNNGDTCDHGMRRIESGCATQLGRIGMVKGSILLCIHRLLRWLDLCLFDEQCNETACFMLPIGMMLFGIVISDFDSSYL